MHPKIFTFFILTINSDVIFIAVIFDSIMIKQNTVISVILQSLTII